MIAVGFLAAICLLIGRLCYLQIIEKNYFITQSEKNQLRIETVESRRGSLLDCKGRFIATNRPVFDLYWQGSGRRSLTIEQENCLRLIQQICVIENESTFLSRIIRAERYGRRTRIAHDCSFESICQISEQCASSPNIVIMNQFKRCYPCATSFCHVVGYVKRNESGHVHGAYGLEKVIDAELEGEEGYVVNVTNATGKIINQQEYKEAFEGKALTTTLDIDLQQCIERVFPKTHVGACVIIEPETGAIRALFSYPTFDPTLFIEPISQKAWKELFVQESPFLNRAVHATYPPASLFKVVTCAAGLELGLINEHTFSLCRGYSRFCNRNYFCVKRAGHGLLTCKEFIAYSCNIPCYEIAKAISIDDLAEYAYRFGLGSKTNALLNDHEGLVPTSQWKRWHKKEPWWKGETLSSSIGQSYLLATPLQMARLIASLFTGSLVKPRILEREPIIHDPLFIQESTRALLREGLYLAVQKGTGRMLRPLSSAGFELYIKTGTAQTSSLERSQQDKRYLEHGWVASYFRYKNQKPLVCIVVLERTGASRPALETLRRFLEEYKTIC